MNNIFERIFNDQYSAYEEVTKDREPSEKQLELERAQDEAYDILTDGLSEEKVEQVDALQDAIYAANNILMARSFAAGARFGIQAAMEALRENKESVLTELMSILEKE